MGGGNAGGFGLAEGFAPDGFDFEFAPGEVVDEGGGFVGPHGAGAFDLVVGGFDGDGVPEFPGDGDGFEHECAAADFERRVGEDAVDGEVVFGDGESVEGNVPDEFAPALLNEILHGAGLDAGFGEGIDDGMCAREGRAAEFADGQGAVVEVADAGGAFAGEADEAEAAEDAIFAGEAGEELFVAESVLEREQEGVGTDEGREERGDYGVLCGLEGDENEVADADAGGGGMDLRSWQVEIAIRTEDVDALVAGFFEAGAHEEVDVLSGGGEPGAVVEADGAGADNGDFHLW